jgi:hypothetical protein
MGAHALDREIGLPGVGWTEDRPDRGIVAPRHRHECGSAPGKRKHPSTKGAILNGH